MVSVSITGMASSEYNRKKSHKVASLLFPGEAWIFKEPNIYVAESRLVEERYEPQKWRREMEQVRILTSRGSVAYFLPEQEQQGESGHQCADLVLDGEVVEMKQVSGTRSTLGTQFKYGYKQGAALVKERSGIRKHSVFVRLLSDISAGSVKAKIAGELKNRNDEGRFLCYFETTGELHEWSYKELRGIIGGGQKKSPGPE